MIYNISSRDITAGLTDFLPDFIGYHVDEWLDKKGIARSTDQELEKSYKDFLSELNTYINALPENYDQITDRSIYSPTDVKRLESIEKAIASMKRFVEFIEKEAKRRGLSIQKLGDTVYFTKDKK
jgi:hypothetical protein